MRLTPAVNAREIHTCVVPTSSRVRDRVAEHEAQALAEDDHTNGREVGGPAAPLVINIADGVA